MKERKTSPDQDKELAKKMARKEKIDLRQDKNVLDLKHEILRYIWQSRTPVDLAEINNKVYPEAGIMQQKHAVDDLMTAGLLKEDLGHYYHITPGGITYLESETVRRWGIIVDRVRYDITTIVSIAALIIAILGLCLSLR